MNRLRIYRVNRQQLNAIQNQSGNFALDKRT